MCKEIPLVEPAAHGGKKYFRYRKVLFGDGTSGHALETRYTYQRARRPVCGPRGGRAYQIFYRQAYYADGIFYRMANHRDERGAWRNILVPIDGRLWDAYPIQTKREGMPSISIQCGDGRPVSTSGALSWYNGCGASFADAVAPWAGLTRTMRKRPSGKAVA
jgi:hypothetical protein